MPARLQFVVVTLALMLVGVFNENTGVFASPARGSNHNNLASLLLEDPAFRILLSPHEFRGIVTVTYPLSESIFVPTSEHASMWELKSLRGASRSNKECNGPRESCPPPYNSISRQGAVCPSNQPHCGAKLTSPQTRAHIHRVPFYEPTELGPFPRPNDEDWAPNLRHRHRAPKINPVWQRTFE